MVHASRGEKNAQTRGHDCLDVPDQRPHREDRLHQQAFLPLTALTPCEGGGSPWGVRPGGGVLNVEIRC